MHVLYDITDAGTLRQMNNCIEPTLIAIGSNRNVQKKKDMNATVKNQVLARVIIITVGSLGMDYIAAKSAMEAVKSDIVHLDFFCFFF